MLRGLTELATHEIAAAGRRRTAQYGLYVLSVACFTTSAAFLLAALHAMLAASYGSAPASFMMAAGTMALALAFFTLGRVVRRRRQPSVAASAALAMAPLALGLIGPALAKRIAR